jgi:AraC-like DNA-binding protein
VLPDGCVDILFTSRDGQPAALDLVGLMTVPQKFDVPAGQSFFGVRFRPGMASAFIPDAAKLIDKMEPLENVLGATGRCLFEEIANAKRVEEMVRVMETFLRPLEPLDTTRKVLVQLADPSISVDRLASEAGISTRQLRRMCLQHTGVSPKYLGRIVRFRRVVQHIGAAAARSIQPNWAELAAACGYFDQAHFIREFQEFTDLTPGRYLQSLRPRPL